MKSFRLTKQEDVPQDYVKNQFRLSLKLMIIAVIGFGILGLIFWVIDVNPLEYFGWY